MLIKLTRVENNASVGDIWINPDNIQYVRVSTLNTNPKVTRVKVVDDTISVRESPEEINRIIAESEDEQEIYLDRLVTKALKDLVSSEK